MRENNIQGTGKKKFKSVTTESDYKMFVMGVCGINLWCKSMMEQLQRKIVSKIGPIYLVASAKGLRGVFWLDQGIPKTGELFPEGEMILEQAVREVAEYFEGKRKEFQVPLDMQGTEFQVNVWKRLLGIPYGKTKSYKEIAVDIESPRASRAVGTAIGKNPLSLIVPCHRVIASDGGLGGYSGGLDIKRKLLEFEQAQLGIVSIN